MHSRYRRALRTEVTPTPGNSCPLLRISRPNDRHEREADRLAANAAPLANGLVSAPSPDLHRTGGKLPEALRSSFELRLGHSFANVRLHTGPEAARLAEALSARAFTLGRDIFFGAGQYAPASAEGRRLIAHELAHVLQHDPAMPVIRRKIQFDDPPNYVPVNPIERILGNKAVGLTTPTFNHDQIPNSGPDAAEKIFAAIQPRQTTYKAATKECNFADFPVTLSANVIIPTKPEDGKWIANLPGPDISSAAGCGDKEHVPVVMRGKPDSDAARDWILANEQEHNDDLKKLCGQHLEPHFKWLMSLKRTGDDGAKCQKNLMSALGNKDALVVKTFLKEWSDSIVHLDQGGRHTLKNAIKVKEHCDRIEIESKR